MKINSNSNNNVDSLDNYSGKNIEEDLSSLWRDKVEYVDLSSSITTTEITKNSRSLPLFLLGNVIAFYLLLMFMMIIAGVTCVIVVLAVVEVFVVSDC